jgi:hypothetical protein
VSNRLEKKLRRANVKNLVRAPLLVRAFTDTYHKIRTGADIEPPTILGGIVPYKPWGTTYDRLLQWVTMAMNTTMEGRLGKISQALSETVPDLLKSLNELVSSPEASVAERLKAAELISRVNSKITMHDMSTKKTRMRRVYANVKGRAVANKEKRAAVRAENKRRAAEIALQKVESVLGGV